MKRFCAGFAKSFGVGAQTDGSIARADYGGMSAGLAKAFQLWFYCDSDNLDTRNSIMLAHAVYFTLQDDSDAAKKRLVDSCHEHLSGHDGTAFYAAGALEPNLDRPVNDHDFDVSLYVVFIDRAAHDAYQQSPRHLQFIEENKSNWKQVRVFDSNVAAAPSS